MVDGLVYIGGDDNVAAVPFDVVCHWCLEAVRLVPVQEGRLQAVALIKEVEHSREDEGHAEAIGSNEVKGLDHGNKDSLLIRPGMLYSQMKCVILSSCCASMVG